MHFMVIVCRMGNRRSQVCRKPRKYALGCNNVNKFAFLMTRVLVKGENYRACDVAMTYHLFSDVELLIEQPELDILRRKCYYT